MNSRTKGKVIERQAAKAILQHIGIEVRRTAQVDGKLSADLIGWPGVHLESKGRHRIAALRFLSEAKKTALPGYVTMVVMSDNKDGEHTAMISLADLPELARRIIDDCVWRASGVSVGMVFRHRIAALGFLRQAERDATDGNIPTVLMRENGDTEFVVMVRLSDLPELARKVVEAKWEA